MVVPKKGKITLTVSENEKKKKKKTNKQTKKKKKTVAKNNCTNPYSWKKCRAEHRNVWKGERCEMICAQYGKLWKHLFGMWKCVNPAEQSTVGLECSKVWTRGSVYLACHGDHSCCIQKPWETLSWSVILKGTTKDLELPKQLWGTEAKQQAGGIILPYFRQYYTTTVIKTLWYWFQNSHTGQ